jgi:hypothetical protein
LRVSHAQALDLVLNPSTSSRFWLFTDCLTRNLSRGSGYTHSGWKRRCDDGSGSAPTGEELQEQNESVGKASGFFEAIVCLVVKQLYHTHQQFSSMSRRVLLTLVTLLVTLTLVLSYPEILLYYSPASYIILHNSIRGCSTIHRTHSRRRLCDCDIHG